ncbi:MAG: L-serine ammonia-lyase, iron-sulfur-dependent subunit beta [Candidatus Hodarchaeota archaeon]
MRINSVFDVIGPVMVGPSSSHTAGAVRIGMVVHQLLGEIPKEATILLHGSFADTYRGHGTDRAIVAGLLGFNTDDERITDAFDIAKQNAMKVEFKLVDLGDEYHANTAKIVAKGLNIPKIEIVGSSIGGGNILIVEINGFKTELTGDYDTIITLHQDRSGVVSKVTSVLSKHDINVAFMRVSRKAKGREAFMAIEVDYLVPSEALDEIASFGEVKMVRLMKAISPAGGA